MLLKCHFFVSIFAFSFYIKPNIDNRLGYSKKKDLSISLKELNKLNVKSGFKSIIIENINCSVII